MRSTRLWALLATALLIGLSFAPGVAAQEKPAEPERPETSTPETDQAYRLDLVRRMDTDQKARLRRALEEFQQLPPERQRELRRKAKQVGAERLMGLAGQDVDRLRKRHDAMRRRREALLEMIGPEQLAGLSDVEKAYVHAMATRRFHEYYKNSMLKLVAPIDRNDWTLLSEDERRSRSRAARERFETAVLERRSDEERTEYANLDAGDRKAKMCEFMEAEHERLAMDYAPVFERAYLKPFLASPPEERAKQVERFRSKGRWYEVRKLLFRELSREYRRRLAHLRPDQLAKLHSVWEQGAELTPAERRTNIQSEIDRLYAEAAARGDEGRFRPPHRRGGGNAIQGGERGDDRRKRRGPRRAPR